jgi:hypothetical protein
MSTFSVIGNANGRGWWMAVRSVIEKLLRPIGTDMSPNAFNEAAGKSEEA